MPTWSLWEEYYAHLAMGGRSNVGVEVDLLGGVFMGLRAYNSEIYDAYFTGIEGEVDFYVEEAMDCGGPVLELGCGTGRVLLPIARSGIEITGLDIDHDLLNLLRRKALVKRKRGCSAGSRFRSGYDCVSLR